MESSPISTDVSPASASPLPTSRPVAARLAGILGLAGATVGGLVLGLGASLPLVAGLAATFVGALGAARLLAGGEERFQNRALRWLARRSQATWVNWGTGVYGLGALTHFIYLESRWLFALGGNALGVLDRSLGDWISWSITEAMEALVHAIESIFWPIDLYLEVGLMVAVAVIASGWLAWKLAWQGMEDPIPALSGPASGAPSPDAPSPDAPDIGPTGVSDPG